MILGTAGHIDHGKTALVRALTGVDTDRLPEEKRRGITIDLGFAPLRLADGTTIGVVDVPGHEAFVRTMLAGASGIDLGLLVIAADEGPMPQTREHLAILELLHVPRLVVALTKTDLVDPDWLALVTADVRDLLKPTPFSEAAIIPTSATTGAGLADLRTAITRSMAESREPRADNDLFRLPIDRVFTVKGTGTVVTGTVWSGQLAVDDTVRVLPGSRSARVRGLQSHGAAVKRIGPGQRAAIALAGVEVDDLERGATLVTNPSWEPSLILRADLSLLPDAPELRPRTRVRFHLATADVGARVVAAGTPVAPGTSRPVRIVLDEPVAARSGDRFVLRSASPLATIGGGTISDSHSPRRARPMATLGLDDGARLALFVHEAGLHGVPHSLIPVRVGAAPQRLQDVTSRAKGITRLGDRWYDAGALDDAGRRLTSLVEGYLAEHPLATGAPRSEVMSRMHVDQALFDRLVEAGIKEGKLKAAGAELAPPAWAPALSGQQQQSTDELMAAIEAAGTEPPSVSELEARFGRQTLSLLRHLERGGRVVQVEDARFYAPSAVRELLGRMERAMAGGRELAPTDLRETLGFSRKFLIPFLEYCDKRGYTVRSGNGRVWRGAAR
ncbi:MAG TPA: selenocysteine-specific translation elongation factor [Gemmatimonadaceae bacterium]|nr:selenocysteine-specific translation elongation factor [Gemmatimonadaceae bacterium]